MAVEEQGGVVRRRLTCVMQRLEVSGQQAYPLGVQEAADDVAGVEVADGALVLLHRSLEISLLVQVVPVHPLGGGVGWG